jgi:hypothetical protein
MLLRCLMLWKERNQRVFDLNRCAAMPIALVSTVQDSVRGFAEDPTTLLSSLFLV